MMGKEALSSAFSEMILEEAKKDKNIMVVCTDSRGSEIGRASCRERV